MRRTAVRMHGGRRTTVVRTDADCVRARTPPAFRRQVLHRMPQADSVVKSAVYGNQGADVHTLPYRSGCRRSLAPDGGVRAALPQVP